LFEPHIDREREKLAETAPLTFDSPGKLAKFDGQGRKISATRNAIGVGFKPRRKTGPECQMLDLLECKRSAETSGSANNAQFTLTLPDPRADDRRRKVELTRQRIILRRVVGGVAMHVQLPVSAYCGIALCLTEPDCGDSHFELRLVHRDPEMSVRLVRGDEEAAVIEHWRNWLAFFALPPLLERDLGCYVAAEGLARLGALGTGPARPRRRNATLASRRGRFGLRRKIGRLDRLMAVFFGEREIICYE
jgi:hypothetical protein